MAFIKKIKIEDTIYEAKTDYRTAIKCNDIATDESIGNFERTLGVLCTMFGPKALDNPSHYEKLLKWAQNWLSCGKEVKHTNDKPDMDFTEDMDYIVASFQSDFGINLDEQDMDWHRFITLLNGLSNSEFGNCCVLNRVRNIRNYDLSKVKDVKERQKIKEAQREVALKKYMPKRKEPTEKQKHNAEEFYKKLKI